MGLMQRNGLRGVCSSARGCSSDSPSPDWIEVGVVLLEPNDTSPRIARYLSYLIWSASLPAEPA